ncbi:F-box/LRR-repeat protein [Thalictrum thalictroides]|uniref:F-box/LRR-repeat protein n=1 Tax=Thalictrum thalictroides TaxID=46969 RepID=A0A7J6X9Q7_THATH|nr:F-box/LRR-repeat protein [Thalictrum thalictroides]
MDESIREKFSKSLFVNGVRKWEDLHTDCLVKIFATVDIESLIVHLPLVCKSWYKASLDPLCWKFLDFEYLHLATSFKKLFHTQDLCAKKAIKYAVKSSCGIATEVAFPPSLVYANILQYVLERCPALKSLTLPYKFIDPCLENELICVPKLINKWKNLESLKLSSDYYFEEILTQINIHCKKFVSLTVEAHHVTEQVASAIVTFVPNIKYLEISSFFLHRDDLMLILSGCRKLELLDLNECLGNFNTNDAEIVAMTSHIKRFESGVVKLANIELIEHGHLPLRSSGRNQVTYFDTTAICSIM